MKSALLVSGAVGYWVILAAAAPGTTGAVCGGKGYDNGRDSYWDTTDGTYDGCSAQCSKRTECKSFAFKAKECYLYNVAVAGNFEADASSPYTFYDASCIKGSTTSTSTTTVAVTTRKSTTTAVATTTTVKATTSTTKSVTSSSIATTTSAKSTTLALPSTTSKSATSSTKQSTTFSTSTKTSTSSAPLSQPTCAINGNDLCGGGAFTDPCKKGCGCTYGEQCGGYLVPGETIGEGIFGITYAQCVLLCDANQPACIGVNYYRSGSCYLMSKSIGNNQNPGGWFAYRQSCSNPCPTSK